MSKTKRPPNKSSCISNMVEHLENNAPLIVGEIRRWRDIIWDDYLDYQYIQKQSKELVTPAAIHHPDSGYK